jgi:type VI protein secretion system component VasK
MVLILALFQASSALAAVGDGQPQEKPSPIVWAIIMLPALLVFVMIYSIMRRERKRQGVIDTELSRSEQERRRNQEHREAVQARLGALDEKLARVVELLSAIERGQRKGDF